MTAKPRRRTKKSTRRTVGRVHPSMMPPEPQTYDVVGFERAWFGKIWERLGNMQKGMLVLGGLIVGVSTFWTWAGLPWLVTDRALLTQVTNVQTTVEKKIDETKKDMTLISNNNRVELSKNIDEVKKTMESLARGAVRRDAIGLEQQQRMLWVQQQNYDNQVLQTEAALRANANDPILLARKAELDRFKRFLEDETRTVREQLAKARQIDPSLGSSSPAMTGSSSRD